MADFQNLFETGGAPWSLKYYKERMLTALTQDLALREEEGIHIDVCKKVYGALNEAVTITSNIRDGSFIEKHFFQKLEDFRDIYENWNGVSSKTDRKNMHSKLLKRKVSMFSSFYKEQDTLLKSNNAERLRQYELLSNLDKEYMDQLNRTFSVLVSDHGDDLFINLKRTLKTFELKTK